MGRWRRWQQEHAAGTAGASRVRSLYKRMVSVWPPYGLRMGTLWLSTLRPKFRPIEGRNPPHKMPGIALRSLPGGPGRAEGGHAEAGNKADSRCKPPWGQRPDPASSADRRFAPAPPRGPGWRENLTFSLRPLSDRQARNGRPQFQPLTIHAIMAGLVDRPAPSLRLPVSFYCG
jgi:hypothetical protein